MRAAPGNPTPRRRRRRLLAVLAGLVVALTLLELSLQVTSYVAWRNTTAVDQPPGRVVLCIGDSLTFGLGVEPHQAYPTRLQEQLAATGTPCSVVNAGIPGQSSADVLHRLPDLLARLQPEVVVMLVGWNDTWARPARVTEADLSGSSFPLRWRTARLLATSLANSDAINRLDAMPFLGAWHVGQHQFYFAADGTADLGNLPATWQVHGEVVQISPAGGAPFRLRWRMSEGALEFAMFGWDRFQRARRGPATGTIDDAAVDDMLQRGELDAALREMTSAAIAPSLTTRARVATAFAIVGREAEVNDLVTALQTAWSQQHDPAAGEFLAAARLRASDPVGAVAIARDVVRTHPERTACWRVIVDACAAPALVALADELHQVATALRSPWRRAELCLERAVVLSRIAAPAGIAALIEARSLGIGPDESIAAMKRAVEHGADRGDLLRAAAAAPLPAADRDALAQDVRRAAVDDAAMTTVLEDHLQLAAQLVESAGARLVLLGYPFSMPLHETTARTVAARHRAPFISLVDTFAQRLVTDPRSDWFIDPIHCTARGYELMASTITPRLGALFR